MPDTTKAAFRHVRARSGRRVPDLSEGPGDRPRRRRGQARGMAGLVGPAAGDTWIVFGALAPTLISRQPPRSAFCEVPVQFGEQTPGGEAAPGSAGRRRVASAEHLRDRTRPQTPPRRRRMPMQLTGRPRRSRPARRVAVSIGVVARAGSGARLTLGSTRRPESAHPRQTAQAGPTALTELAVSAHGCDAPLCGD